MPFPPQTLAPPVAPATATATAEALPLRGLTLLVVEDSRFACDALRLICLRSGGRLRRAETLAAARAYLAARRPDAVIVDLGLPDGRGEALIAELAARGIPVLGTSGEPEGRAGAMAAGAAGFLDKPIASVAAFQRQILHLVGHGPTAGPPIPRPPIPCPPIPYPPAAYPPPGLTLAASLPPTSLPPTSLPPTSLPPEAWATDRGTGLPAADPLAFRDDLARASALIMSAGDGSYVAAFLRGLGRAAGDRALEEAARAAQTGEGAAALARLVASRLARPQGLA